MGNEKITGRMFVVGADINTDLIIPARYMTTMDPATLGARAMADLDPAEYPVPFLGPDGRSPFAVVVAGPNFGCGSSREHAPIALAAAGVRAVVAPSFARIFYRNAVNGGQLLPLEAEGAAPADWRTGDELTLDIAAGEARGPGGRVLGLKPFGPLAAIVEAGGLTAYNRKRLGL